MLDDEMQRVVSTQRLGYVASVCPDGTPNLSPKGTTAVWDDEHLVFLDIHSPGTVRNVEAGNAVLEINVVDPIRRKGYRFKGPSVVHRDGPVYDEVLAFYETERGTDTSRVNAVVVVTVEHAAAVVSPTYDDGTTEDQIVRRSLDMYGLQRVAPR